MTLRPLLECSDDELERALLLSGRGDAPSPRGLRDTALALGLAAPTAEALATALEAPPSLHHVVGTKAAGSASTLGAPGVTGAAASFGSASLATAGALLVGGVLLSFVAMITVKDRPVPSTPVAAQAARANAPAALNAAPPPLATPASASPLAAPEPAATPENARHADAPLEHERRLKRRRAAAHPAPRSSAPAMTSSAPAPTKPPSTSASLAAEIRLLDRTRAELAAGNAEAARRLLEAYASSKPSEILRQEADLLRVQLQLKLGQRHAAAELARRIIRQNPESTLVDSLRSLAAEP